MSPAAPAGALSRARIPVAVVLTAAALLVALVVPQSARAASTALTVAQMTQQVVDDTNAVRAERRLPALVRDARLDKVAADWAKKQFDNGAMSHNPNYATQIPPGWKRAGENVGKGYTYTQIVAAWKASSSHYANLVNDYTSVGVGYYEQDGHRYWSQVFATYPGTPQPAPSTGPVSSAPAAATRIPLSSPSFESGMGAWTASKSRVDGPNSKARDGSRSLLVRGASQRTLSQAVATEVAPGSTHTLTVYVKANGSAKGTVRLRTVGGVEESAAVTYKASSSGWRKVSVTLTTASAHTGFVIEVVTGTSGRTYRVDAASLVRAG
jgi:uncharacterized protein YkwD